MSSESPTLNKEQQDFLAQKIYSLRDYVDKHLLYKGLEDPEARADLTSVVLGKAAENVLQGIRIDHPKTYLQRAAYHTLVDVWRHNNKKSNLKIAPVKDQEYLINNASEELSPIKLLDSPELKTAFWSVLRDALSEKQFEVFYVRYALGMSREDAAEKIGVTPNYLSVISNRAIKALQKPDVKSQLKQFYLG